MNLTRIWLTISGLMLSFVFIFGNSIKTLFESVVYLFVVRPFDVGDAILLGAAQDWCTVGFSLPFACKSSRWGAACMLAAADVGYGG